MLRTIKIVAGIVSVALIITVVWFVFQVRVVATSIVLSATAFYFISPFVSILERKGFSKSIAIILIFSAIIILSVVFMKVSVEKTIPYITSLKNDFPENVKEITSLLEKIEKKVSIVYPIKITERVQNSLVHIVERLFESAPSAIKDIFLTLLITPFMTFYFLKSSASFKRKMFEKIPNKYFEMFLVIFWKAEETIKNYIKAFLQKSFVLSLISLIALLVYGLDFSISLIYSILFGFSPIVPYIGPFVTTVAAGFLTIAIGGVFQDALFVVLVSLSAHIIDNIVISPLMFSHSINLHPVSVLILVILGEELFGILGAIAIVPIAAVIKVVISEFLKNAKEYKIW